MQFDFFALTQFVRYAFHQFDSAFSVIFPANICQQNSISPPNVKSRKTLSSFLRQLKFYLRFLRRRKISEENFCETQPAGNALAPSLFIHALWFKSNQS